MMSAFLTAPPPAALPPLAGVLATFGLELLFAVVVAAFAVIGAVLLQHAVTTRSTSRPALDVVEHREPSVPHAA